MDPEFSDLIPVFVEEARERLDRLASLLPRLPEAAAVVEAKRELHTLKGATRMLDLGSMAELCHAAEEALVEGREDRVGLLTVAADRLVEMLEVVASGAVPEGDAGLVARLDGSAGAAERGETGALGGGGAAGQNSAGAAGKAHAEFRPAASPEGESGAHAGTEDRAGAEKEGPHAGGEEGGTHASGGGAAAAPGAASSSSPDSAAASASSVPSGASAGGQTSSSPGGSGEVRIDVELPTGGIDSSGEEEAVAGAPASGPVGGGEVRVSATALDSVADLATQLRLMALGSGNSGERLYDLARLAEGGLHEEQPKQVLAVLSTMLRRLAVEIEGDQRLMLRAAESQLDQVLGLQLQPLRGPLLAMARNARQLASRLGREIEVEISGQDTGLDRRIARDLEDALIHLVRNSVDHGIEPPEERERAGKPRTGHLHLAAESRGQRVRLEIRDDGAGIDPDRVLEQAVASGLVDGAAARSLGREAAFRLLFAPGFSTRSEVSEISGRGVGLDVVAAAVARVGGEVFLRSELGRGTTVAVEVPVARRGEQVLVLRVGQLRLALPAAVVRNVEEIGAEDVVERGGRFLARLDGRLVPFVPLARQYGQEAAGRQLLLEGLVSGQRLAVAVDDVEGEEEVLVRPLPSVAVSDRLLEGMALLSTGRPVAVLSPAALARRDLLGTQRAVPAIAPVRRVRVLLVDDSLVTREMERRLLEDAGFLVTAAGDADEALGQLGEATFDCIVTDIEMPGMDGFELTRHLRGMEQFAQLPIVVVSTRDRPEDRLQGLRAGADAYFTKQGLDAGELVALVRRLAGR